MTRAQESCPRPADLERGYWEHDESVVMHARSCASCRTVFASIESLSERGAELDTPSMSRDHKAELHARLLAGLNANTASPAKPRNVVPRVAIGIALTAAAAAAIMFAMRGGESEPQVVHRGSVTAQEGADFDLTSTQPDEIVHLVNGTITVQVDKLAVGERFRVQTRDGEVEVKGTRFDVTAVDGRLVSVRVHHGRVVVRTGKHFERVLEDGENWASGIRTAKRTPIAPPTLSGPEPPNSATAPNAAPNRVATRARRSRSRTKVAMRTQTDAGLGAQLRTQGRAAFEAGWRHLNARRYQKAAEAFERAARARDRAVHEDGRYWASVSWARAGDPNRARAGFVSFLKRFGTSSRAGEVSVMLGWSLYDANRYEQARRRFEAAKKDRDARVRASAAKGLAATAAAKP